MRRYVVSVCVSIDGFQEGVDGDLSVMPFDDGFSRHNVELLRRASTVVHGGRGFDGGAYWAAVLQDDAQPPIEHEIARLNEGLEHVVVSDSVEVDPSWPWADATRVVPRAEAIEAVRRMKGGDGGDLVTYGSATTWSPLLEAGLVDELHVLVGPAVLGGGGPAYRGDRVPLRLLDATALPDSQLVRLRYDARGR
ncbi:dihydrofolate reductase family protein [Amnibacterium endophyticum]|uniref:Dihydrofolate reductase family protein n=1 Tax=Amnibacterium endophyticum TaxID=2109337 RepID=A0ABW4LEZ8_9MICO